MAYGPHLDSPLAGVTVYDLAAPAGFALLRRLDAQFHRLPLASRSMALESVSLALPLACRAEGLLVLPGGAIVWRRGATVLLADPSSSVGVTTSARLLKQAVSERSGNFFISHMKNGLQIGHHAAFSEQSVTIVPRASLYADILPELLEWRGPAIIHWQPQGAAMWEMVPAPPPFALAASLIGEPLDEHGPLSRSVWAPGEGADGIYQHLSSGLAGHLDEWLANEVSDALRYSLIARWTDGEDSIASRLADGIADLPTAFGADPAGPVTLAPLASWPAGMVQDGSVHGLMGLSQLGCGAAWTPALRRQALHVMREVLPAEAVLTDERMATRILIGDLAADRLVRSGVQALAALVPLEVHDSPARLLHRAERMAERLRIPLLLTVPAWGLCHQFDPNGMRQGGNGPAFGLGAGLERFERA